MNTLKTNTSSTLRLTLFLVLAIGISNLFRFDVLEIRPQLQTLPAWIYVSLSALLEGSGVIIGAIVTLTLLRKERKTEISFWGDSPKASKLMAIVPLILVPIIGIKNTFGMQENVYGFVAVAASFFYCIFEEYGWRGYLQEEFKVLPSRYVQYILIGCIWYIWHLSFLKEASVAENLFFLGMLILGSWGIAQVAIATKSIVACACFHLLIQLMLFNSLIKDGINGTQKFIILGICLLVWIILLRRKQKVDSPEVEKKISKY